MDTTKFKYDASPLTVGINMASIREKLEAKFGQEFEKIETPTYPYEVVEVTLYGTKIEVPYRPLPNGETPPHVAVLTGRASDDQKVRIAAPLLKTLVAREAHRQLAISASGHEGQIVMCESLQKYEYSVTDHGQVVISNSYGKELEIDTDGDRGTVIMVMVRNPSKKLKRLMVRTGTFRQWRRNGNLVHFVLKYPQHGQFMPMKFVSPKNLCWEMEDDLPVEFHEWNHEPEVKSGAEWEENFRNRHKPNQVGIATVFANMADIHDAQANPELAWIGANLERRVAMIEADMKAARKSVGELDKYGVEYNLHSLKYPPIGALIHQGNVNGFWELAEKFTPEQLQGMFTNIHHPIWGTQPLKEKPELAEREQARRPKSVYTGWSDELFQNYVHEERFKHPLGHMAIFTFVVDGHQVDMSVTKNDSPLAVMAHHILVSPVIKVLRGEVVVLQPREVLQLALEQQMRIPGKSLKAVLEMKDADGAQKHTWVLSKIQNILQETLSRCGSPIMKTDEGWNPTTLRTIYASGMVWYSSTLVDNTLKEIKAIHKWFAEQGQGLGLLTVSGTKGKAKEFVRYLLGKKLDEPVLYPKGCNVRRQGDLIAQVANSMRIGKATFFVVDGADENQLLATKDGVKLQEFEKSIYLPTIVTEDLAGEHGEVHTVRKLDGRVLKVHTVNPKNRNSKMGKIITLTGTKNVAVDLRQKVTIQETGEVVHFIMPWKELKAKGCLQYWRERGEPGSAFINGKLVKGWVVKLEAFRTLNPGENLRGRRRVASLRGYAAWFLLGIDIDKYYVSFKNPVTGKHEWRVKEDLSQYDPKKWEYWHILYQAAKAVNKFAEDEESPIGDGWD